MCVNGMGACMHRFIQGGGVVKYRASHACVWCLNAATRLRRIHNPYLSLQQIHQVSKWKSPYILMVDRGDCTFVTKVRLYTCIYGCVCMCVF